MVQADEDAETGAIKSYNDTIAAAVKLADNGTREMIAKILQDEERHVDWGETQRELIKQMGLQNYLTHLSTRHHSSCSPATSSRTPLWLQLVARLQACPPQCPARSPQQRPTQWAQ